MIGEGSSEDEDSYGNLLWSKVIGCCAFAWDEKP